MEKPKIICPVCENEITELEILSNLETLEIGDIIECPICGSTLEVLDIDKTQNKITFRAIVKSK